MALTDRPMERALLGAMLLDPAAVVPRVVSLVGRDDFSEPRHATLWEVFLAVHGRGEAVDILTVTAELRARDRLHTIGGAQYLGELTDLMVALKSEMATTSHAESHARLLASLGARRRARDVCQAAALRVEQGVELSAVQADVQRVLVPASDAGGAVGGDVDAFLDTCLARMEGRERPLPSPWRAVDEVLGGGLWPGMYVLVGGTGAGKTQWAVQLGVCAAQAGARVLYLALELGRQDLVARVVGDLAGLPWSNLARGQIRADQFERLSEASRAAKALPFVTECGAPFGYGADTLAARAWAMRPQLVVVDYLQLCVARGEEPRVSVGRVSYVARTIARDLGAVVVVLSSTARANYAELVNNPDADPVDLVGLGKESGEIEYAADGVLVLARSTDPQSSRRTLVVSKNRYGPTGRVELDWSGTRFTEPARGEGTFL